MAVTRGPFNVAPLFLKPARAALFEDADGPFSGRGWRIEDGR